MPCKKRLNRDVVWGTTGELIKMPFGIDSCRSKEPHITWGPHPPRERALLKGECAWGSTSPSGRGTFEGWMCPTNVFTATSGDTAMRPLAKLRGTFVIIYQRKMSALTRSSFHHQIFLQQRWSLHVWVYLLINTASFDYSSRHLGTLIFYSHKIFNFKS